MPRLCIRNRVSASPRHECKSVTLMRWHIVLSSHMYINVVFAYSDDDVGVFTARCCGRVCDWMDLSGSRYKKISFCRSGLRLVNVTIALTYCVIRDLDVILDVSLVCEVTCIEDD